MAKKPTPMKRSKEVIERFINILKMNRLFKKERSYNKTESKEVEYYASYDYISYTTKGVKSDYIRIIFLDETTSLGFSFNNIKSENDDEIVIEVSLKTLKNKNSEDYEMVSKLLTFNKFKELLKLTTKSIITLAEILNNDIDIDSCVKVINTNFDINGKKDPVLNSLKDDNLKRIKKNIKDKIDEVNIIEEKENKIIEEYTNIDKKHTNKVNYLKRKHNINELQKKLDEAQKLMDTELKEFEDTNNFNDLRVSFKKSRNSIDHEHRELRKFINNELSSVKTLPNQVRKDLENTIKEDYKKELSYK